MKYLKILTSVVIALFLANFITKKKEVNQHEIGSKMEQTSKVAYFASGCFWCVEAIFESVEGVNEAVSGYAGGHTKSPTYQTIGTGRTGHAETVAVYYNPEKVTYETLVNVFFGSHNPTTKNGQHPDYGTQYRSIAFYTDLSEKKIIAQIIKKLNEKVYDGKIVTEVTKLTQFFPAEEYHQNYEKLHPDNPYVRNVSVPRLNRFKKKFPNILKMKEH
ncbi:peptide-methionine (S)-S-oxide reductase MsrA [Tenacibaculum maritimum]|uniref:peptide-methionine (S)-S-oxide reductase MsrA n=1 Tax=Tenacibaculum maritimum TaxID=107401 RepID=UPI0012E5C92A|nr:peptide-methionine (S)-S-oxide reductase MsrA [Tenacibaculum maritimum]MCD9582595.1 peptide-methionine (S)-S-oxide reductase MsrA [Tenacibaculum maritimum]MCD9584339.1 peptide-methionine (S)-S-oxide reductase MsrA [Tenacibaculum maritimum]MCD9609637.1 peptide-methionine (S)-S-oxide reductase MsrA [Tenacibaculum maritimum]MCD9620140.1 peptide-methionine (S)-S-oxide reductase MsrA [Tenacibaculum maritimum]MCD9626267.1 peptide-methionine (S)-S-oxide reductase MsrA [Tenacibaculum maritimum]